MKRAKLTNIRAARPRGCSCLACVQDQLQKIADFSKQQLGESPLNLHADTAHKAACEMLFEITEMFGLRSSELRSSWGTEFKVYLGFDRDGRAHVAGFSPMEGRCPELAEAMPPGSADDPDLRQEP